MALFSVTYRIEHYEADPSFSLGCEFIEAPPPQTAVEARAITQAVVETVRNRCAQKALNFRAKYVFVTGIQRLDAGD